MYRNIVYKLNEWEGEIVLFTWDDEGNPIEKIFPHKSHVYVESPNGKYRSMFGTPLERITFSSVIERSRWMRSHPKTKVFDSFKPEREFMLDYFGGQQEEEGFSRHPLRVHFIDIEIAVEDEFPEPDRADYPIDVLTVHDSKLSKYFTWILTDDRWCKGDEKWKSTAEIEYRVFDDERLMIRDYIEWHKANIPDVISGWNVESFDIPYLITRAKKFLIEPEVAMMSPLMTIKKRVRNQRHASKPVTSYLIEGISILDYLMLYRYKFGANLQSYKLDAVGMEELEWGKMEYEGSIKQFYIRDFKRFVEYNVRDVKLCVALDNKLKFIDLARKICNIGLCEYEAIFKSSPYITGAITLEARKEGLRILTDSRLDYESIDTHYEGAYVAAPRVGAYTNGVASLDLNSLYPNIMINLNISPETKIGKITHESGDGTATIMTTTGRVKTTTREGLKKLQGRATLSSNGVLYMNPEVKKGIIPKFLERLYKERKRAKGKMIRMKKDLSELKETGTMTTEELAAMEIQIMNLHNTQHSLKIFLNSIYGQMGNKYFPLFDVDNASAVTITGQRIIKRSMEFVNQYMRDHYGATGEVTIYGDTDSVYLDVTAIVQTVLGKEGKLTKRGISKVCKEIDNMLVAAVNEMCAELSDKEFMSPLRNIEFKRETFCSEGVFVAKKRYVLHVKNDEGVPVDKWKSTGVDIQKNELPPQIKKILKRLIYCGLEERWDNTRYFDEITVAWEKFLEMSPDELAITKSYSTEKAHDGFLQAGKGAGAHVKAVMYYNDLIDSMGLKSKYDPIPLGDKVKYVYITKNNRYGIDIIGWKDDFPDEFRGIFCIDQRKMFEKTVLSPIKRFVDIYGWSPIHPADDVITDLMAL